MSILAAVKKSFVAKTRLRLLDPVHRICEILFGLIMVLTFTGSLSVAQTDREEVRTMLIGALGCNLAWGIIDAAFYLMTAAAEKRRERISLDTLRTTHKATTAHRILKGALHPIVVSVLRPGEIESICRRIKALPVRSSVPRLKKHEWLVALAVFAWVFASTFPVVVPFLFMEEARPALRMSNAIAIGMLFWLGCLLGRYAEWHPWRTGLVMVFVGAVLVGMTIALGG